MKNHLARVLALAILAMSAAAALPPPVSTAVSIDPSNNLLGVSTNVFSGNTGLLFKATAPQVNVASNVLATAINAAATTANAALTRTGDGISGIFSLKNDLHFDGDTNAPNTNWIYNLTFGNLSTLENTQTKTVSWYGKENMLMEGGIITITADTNLSFVTANTRAVFVVPTNQWVLSLTGAADANGNVPADFIPLDNLALTNALFAGFVAGYDATTKKLTKSSVQVTNVARADSYAALRVDNIAALAALPAGTATRIDLLGYSAAGDGGGGLLYFTNTITGTNTGTRYVANGGGSWQRYVSSPYNPRWFGAVGDYVTDDTVAFQSALNLLDPTISNTNQFQVRIQITPGWYKIGSVTNPYITEIYGTTKIKGAGFSTVAPTLFQKSGVSGAMIQTAPGKNISVHDLQLSGRASANIQNSNTVAAVTDRTHFAVSSTNNVPPRVLTNFPYGGVCLFYTTNNTLVGSGVVGAVTGGTNITIQPGYDWFATDSSSNLSTGWIVAFTPWKNWTNASGSGKSPYITADPTNFFAPAGSELGNCAIELVRTFNSVISHCNINGFTTGIGTLGANGVFVDNCDFYSCHLAGIWMDNCFDSTIDTIEVTGQTLVNGTYKNEYSSVISGMLNQGTAIADSPPTNNALCSMTRAVGGWNISSCLGNHWRMDNDAVGINWSGGAYNEVFKLADVTDDNCKVSIMVLEGIGYTQADWVRSFTYYLLNNTYPAIQTHAQATLLFDTLELLNVASITPRFSYAVDTSGGTPAFAPVIHNLLMVPTPASVLVNTNQYNNPATAVVPYLTGGQLPSGTTLAADATAALQPTTLQQLGVVGTLATNAMPKAGGTFSGLIKLPNGSPANPSIAGANDTTTGYYWPTSGQLAFASSGVSVMKIYPTPSLVFGAGAVDDASGYGVQITGNSGGGFGTRISDYGVDNNLDLRRMGGSYASPSATPNGSKIRVVFEGSTNGTSSAIGARIEATALAAWSVANYGMSLDFYTSDAVSTTGSVDRVKMITTGVAMTDTGTVAAPDNSAVLDLASTARGLLAPRMTRAQFDSISSRANGLIGYDTTANKPVVYNGTRSYNGTLELVSNGNTVIFGALTALTAATPTSGTITVTGAQVGDAVVVTPGALNSGSTHVDGVVTSANTVTLYAEPLVLQSSAQTNSMNIKVIAQ